MGSPTIFPGRNLTPAEALRLDRCRLSFSHALPNLGDGPQSRRSGETFDQNSPCCWVVLEEDGTQVLKQQQNQRDRVIDHVSPYCPGSLLLRKAIFLVFSHCSEKCVRIPAGLIKTGPPPPPQHFWSGGPRWALTLCLSGTSPREALGTRLCSRTH